MFHFCVFWCMSVCVFGVWVYGCVSGERGGGGLPLPPQKTVFCAPPKLSMKVASGSQFGPLFGRRRPRTLLKSFSGAFLHKVSVSKNCFRAAKNTLPYTHFANKILPFALFPDIYWGKIQQFLKTCPFWNGMGQLVYECMCIFLGKYWGKRAIHSYTNELSSIVFWCFLTLFRQKHGACR